MANRIKRCISLGPPVVWSTLYDDTTYLPLAGGTMSGNLILTNATADGHALNRITADGRYVDILGDTMTGGLIINRTGGTGIGTDAAGIFDGAAGPSIALRRTGTYVNTPYIGFYDSTLATRYGYIQSTTSAISLASDVADVRLVTNNVSRYSITSAGAHSWETGTMTYDAATALLRIGPSTTDSIRVSRTGNSPFIAFYDTTFATRYGYIQAISTTGLVLNAEQSVSAIVFRTQGVEGMRLDPYGNLLVGKTATNGATNGCEMLTGGTILATRSDATAPMVINKVSAATGSPMVTFQLDGTAVGSVTRNALTSAVLYNTTSHAEWKGNVTDLDDDEALDRVELWRPVAFQWKVDGKGNTTEDGTPTGEVVHGFIAQEMNEVNPSAVSPGFGTEDEHRAWMAEWATFNAATADRLVEVERQEQVLEAWRIAVEATEDGDESPTEPTLPPLPILPDPPTDADPFLPWSGDWTSLVPDLTAAVQALIRQVRFQTNRIDLLESR